MLPDSPAAEDRQHTVQGQPCIRLDTDQGDSALVALHGAQVLSWTVAGRERLYLSPRAMFDGRSAIRGGIPLCFPQFNQRGPLPSMALHATWRGSRCQLAMGTKRGPPCACN